MYELHEEQNYVFELAQKYEIPIEMKYHKVKTNTCSEKLELLKKDDSSWTLDRIIKAVYFENDDGHKVGVIQRGSSPVRKKYALRDAFGMVKREIKGYLPMKLCPEGMEFGTCTPFPKETSIGHDIDDIILLDHPYIDGPVDISVGGEGEMAHRTSMHIPFEGIYKILSEKFSSNVMMIPEYVPQAQVTI